MFNDLQERARVLEAVLKNQYSDFYRNKYKNVSLESTKLNEAIWQTVPFLTRKEILETDFYDRLFLDLKEVGIIRVTSGTSGKGVLIMPRIKADNRESKLFKTIFNHYNFKGMATYSGAQFQHAHIYVTENNMDSIALSIADVKGAVNLVTTLKPDLLLGFGYALEALGKALKDTAYAKTVRCIYFFGERTSELRLNAIRSYFPNADLMFDYASIDAQVSVAMSCLSLIKQKSTYVHPIAEYLHAEIIDAETGTLITETGVEGELVITVLKPSAFPLIRYKTGDMARIVTYSCDCGLDTPVIDVRGRVEGTKARFRGGEIQLAELERALAKVVNYAPITVVHINFNEETTSEGIAQRLSLQLQNAATFNFADLSKALEKELQVSPTTTYADAVSKNLILPIKIEAAPPGEEMRKSRGIVIGN